MKNVLWISALVASLLLMAGCADNAGGDAPAPTPKAKDTSSATSGEKLTNPPESADVAHGKGKQGTGEAQDK